jgi:hypothetical protein
MRKLLVSVAALLLATACDRGADRASPADGGTLAGSDTAAGAMVLLLDVPSSTKLGDEVPIAVTLVHRGAAPELGHVSPDVVVTRDDGSEVWRRSRHAAVAPPSPAPRGSEMRGSGYVWDQRDDAGRPVPPGAYRVRAEAAALELVSEPRLIIIAP